MAMVQPGDRIPSVTLLEQIGDDVSNIDIAQLLAGKKAVIFGMPGAYTSTCAGEHLPSVIAAAPALRAKGVEEILVVCANDVRVTEHWSRNSGASEAGVRILADWDSELTKALGLEFSVPAIGFKDRMQRCSMYIEDGEVKILQMEEEKGVCALTTGEAIVDLI